jgi:hypothetical protein
LSLDQRYITAEGCSRNTKDSPVPAVLNRTTQTV